MNPQNVLPEVILCLAAYWGRDGKDINQYDSEAFARTVHRETSHLLPVEIAYAEDYGLHYRGLHCWVEFDNKHYDAETPFGVRSPERLPFFQRNDVKEKGNQRMNTINKPGDIVSCVLNNRFDTQWTPSAQVLLLATESSSITDCFFGAAKDENDHINIVFRVARRPDNFIMYDRGWGDYYSLFTLNYTTCEVHLTAMKRFLPIIVPAIKKYALELRDLPAFKQIPGINH